MRDRINYSINIKIGYTENIEMSKGMPGRSIVIRTGKPVTNRHKFSKGGTLNDTTP